MKQKRLLVLGAGRGQVDLIKAAKAMGIVVIVATEKDGYPGIALADEVCYVNIADPLAVYQKALTLQIDGVATACLDTGIESLGYICDKLGLKGLGVEAAGICNNKYLMKLAFEKEGVCSAKYTLIKNVKELQDSFACFGFPLVVKAVDLQGSRGVFIVSNEDEAIEAFNNAVTLSKHDYCIVEEFIEGTLIGAEAFVYNNNVMFVLPDGTLIHSGRSIVPVGHYLPLDVDNITIKHIKETVITAIKAAKLNNCAVNVDLILKNNNAYIVELTGRVGANGLPELVSNNFGINYYEMIVLCAINDDPRKLLTQSRESKYSYLAEMVKSNKSGIVRYINDENDDNDKDIIDIKLFVDNGSEIRKLENSNDCIGQVIVRGNSMEDCEKKK